MSLPSTMTVPRFLGNGEIMWTEKVVPVPGEGELLVEVGANALCGTDRHQYRQGSPRVTPGHEIAGAVVGGGAGTTTRAGTLGVVYLMAFCGECRSCRLGHTNQCLEKRGDVGFSRDGGLGPYVVVHEHTFFPVGADLAPTEATLLLDVMGTARHAIARATRMRDDIETMLVDWAGPVGLGILAMAKLLFGDSVKVFVLDQSPFRLRLVDKFGGVPIDVGVRDVPEVIRSHGLDGIDASFDTSGRGDSRRSALTTLGHRGVLVCVAHGRDANLELRVSEELIAPERAVIGSEYFGYPELIENLAMLRTHKAYLSQIITHRFPLIDLRLAFEQFLAGSTGKVVVEHR